MKTWTGRSLLSAILVLQVASYKHECKLPHYSFQEAFKVFAIVPQVIPVAPKAPLIRYYGDYKLRFGNRIPVAVTNSLSLYSSWPNVDANALYTMITCDLDYPQFYFNEGVQFINGIIVNIPGANYSRGERIIGYHPPSPLPGAGDNRILTLVCEQKTGRIDITTELILRTTASRAKFSITKFLREFKLSNPVAGNFYRSRQYACPPPGKENNDCCDINCMK